MLPSTSVFIWVDYTKPENYERKLSYHEVRKIQWCGQSVREKWIRLYCQDDFVRKTCTPFFKKKRPDTKLYRLKTKVTGIISMIRGIKQYGNIRMMLLTVNSMSEFKYMCDLIELFYDENDSGREIRVNKEQFFNDILPKLIDRVIYYDDRRIPMKIYSHGKV